MAEEELFVSALWKPSLGRTSVIIRKHRPRPLGEEEEIAALKIKRHPLSGVLISDLKKGKEERDPDRSLKSVAERMRNRLKKKHR